MIKWYVILACVEKFIFSLHPLHHNIFHKFLVPMCKQFFINVLCMSTVTGPGVCKVNALCFHCHPRETIHHIYNVSACFTIMTSWHGQYFYIPVLLAWSWFSTTSQVLGELRCLNAYVMSLQWYLSGKSIFWMICFPTEKVGRGHRNCVHPSVHVCICLSVHPGFGTMTWKGNHSIHPKLAVYAYLMNLQKWSYVLCEYNSIPICCKTQELLSNWIYKWFWAVLCFIQLVMALLCHMMLVNWVIIASGNGFLLVWQWAVT